MSNKFIIPQILFGACFVYLIVQSNLHSADTNFRTSTLTADTHFQGSKAHQQPVLETGQPLKEPTTAEPQKEGKETQTTNTDPTGLVQTSNTTTGTTAGTSPSEPPKEAETPKEETQPETTNPEIPSEPSKEAETPKEETQPETTNPETPSEPSKEAETPKEETQPESTNPETPSEPSNEAETPKEETQSETTNPETSSESSKDTETLTSLKGEGEEPEVIYQRESPNDDLCQQRDQKPVILCRMGIQSHCKRIQISEQLSSWWMICPMYSANVKQTGILYQLHENFRNFAKSYGINFQTVETTFPGQEFLLTKPNNEPYDLQYKADWIFAMRENLVNVGVKHLPDDWQYMSWIDQHIFWMDPYWFEKSIWLFEHHNIVHMLNGNDFWNMQNTTDYSLVGFGNLYAQYGMGFESHDPRQCGLAWGMRREIFEQVGGLFDLCIGTKCDLYQNYAYAGRVYNYQTNSYEYAQKIKEWQENAIRVYDRKLGFLDTKVVHFMHCIDGCKTSDYNLQINALNRFGYSPNNDLKRDEEGRLILFNNMPLAKELWMLYGGAPRL